MQEMLRSVQNIIKVIHWPIPHPKIRIVQSQTRILTISLASPQPSDYNAPSTIPKSATSVTTALNVNASQENYEIPNDYFLTSISKEEFLFACYWWPIAFWFNIVIY